jgi:hypothetical protein
MTDRLNVLEAIESRSTKLDQSSGGITVRRLALSRQAVAFATEKPCAS